MPLQRRLPKRGFKSHLLKYNAEITLTQLSKLGLGEVDLLALKQAGLVGQLAKVVKVVKSGELTQSVKLTGIGATAGAKAAIEAGKPIYVEWPLGRTTAEGVELAALAKAKGVQTAVGLQSRVSPPLMYMKEQIESGELGEIVACRVSLMRDGVLERTASRTWQRDVTLGANTLTIANGHTIDALRFVAGDFKRDRKSTRLNSSHSQQSRMPSSA